MRHFSPKNLAFHSDHRPRGWVRRLVFKNNGALKQPRAIFHRLVFKKNTRPRPHFAPWINSGFTARPHFTPKSLDKMRDEIIKNNKLMKVKTVTIMAIGHVEYNARVMERWLSVLNIRVRVVIGNISKFNDDLYIVMCPQAFTRLPPPMKRIIFQLEQSGRADWFTDDYMNDLTQSLAVFDYSSNNIQFLQDNGISYRDIFELTITPIADYLPKPVAKSPDFDVLFYGAYNPRRNKILKRLGKEFRVKSVCDVYGEEMHDIIRSAPVVVNIHFYENALLETTRISEALSLGARVVSERGSDEDKNRDFEPCVRFCPMDDVEALVTAIKAELAEAGSPVLPIDLMEQAKFRFYRALLALGMVSYKQFCDLTTDWKLPSDKLILSLPENVKRRAYAIESKKQAQEDDSIFFDGLRHRTGWIGCAMSFKYMAQKALDAGFETLQIYEDDACFSKDHQKQLKIINAYLAENKGSWDVFSGLMVDVTEQAEVLDVQDYKGLRFACFNYFVSMVYCIYTKRILEKIAAYPMDNPQKLTSFDQVDIYLRAEPIRCITTIPFLVTHEEDLISAIAQKSNKELYGDYYNESIKMMNKKTNIFINANLLKDASYTATAIENLNASGSANKVAVFYHYFERDEAYRDNLVLFLATGYSPDVDFYIIIASEFSIDLPQKPNIVYIRTDNRNLDYGGYCQALAQINDIDKYEACIFINSSVRGPFVASYFQDDWTKIYTQWLKDDVHLVGAAINTMAGDFPQFDFLTTDYHYPKPYSHVQTTAYALSRRALQHLLKIGFYDPKEQLTKEEVIALYELRLSQEIKKQGWNMKSLCAPYNSIDYRTTHEEINPAAVKGDSLHAGAFFARTLSPLECVFMKTNRDIFASADNTRSLASYTYTSLMTNTHPDMADWGAARDLYDRSETIVRAYAKVLNPFRIFGIVWRSLGKKIRRILG